jgi:4'-phosphopantetheinyl transferase
VDVWLTDLEPGETVVERYVSILTADERARAGRFHFPHDAAHWIVARGTLRAILSDRLRIEPSDVRFVYGEHGKPELAEPFASSGLRFNLSHSGALALCAVVQHCRVGVDIERLRPMPDLEAIAERTFSPRERETLRRLPPELRHEGFFNCWTRKEAYIKAIGKGLAHPLDRFSVSLAPGAPARLETVDDDPREAEAWTLEAFMPSPGYAAALVVEGRADRIVRATWPGGALPTLSVE